MVAAGGLIQAGKTLMKFCYWGTLMPERANGFRKVPLLFYHLWNDNRKYSPLHRSIVKTRGEGHIKPGKQRVFNKCSLWLFTITPHTHACLCAHLYTDTQPNHNLGYTKLESWKRKCRSEWKPCVTGFGKGRDHFSPPNMQQIALPELLIHKDKYKDNIFAPLFSFWRESFCLWVVSG